ncbi:hypothetical protein [Oceanobacillus jeddahense]|uniref:Uncharacterized protein n=1 Tax=Oceanobacillus jeddahense TaxID=1462527 RepID=A0ABY5JMA3_9BACI|nr:hypothetical protein [Oceanobacillus jeddahense]UUI01423.1 hypothetical protein NP439_15335 [Oceanobacillus jeddahense]
MLFLTVFLVDCSDNNDRADDNTDVNSNNEIEAEFGNDNTIEEVNNSDSSDSNEGLFEVTEEEQIDLNIGDTAVVQTSIGTYELIVDGAE